jgi:hypothetical protein
MKRKPPFCLALTLGLLFLSNTIASAPALPNPVLYLSSVEPVTTKGETELRYYFDVDNRSVYPAELFAAAPSLPPCGDNPKASRTWVDLYAMNGKRLNGFCALGKPDDLKRLWFSMKPDDVPPSYVYIEMTDRQTNQKYKSNLAETSL